MTDYTITASAPGKIHFLGEHTAVYGKPALLAAIDKRCYVELTPTQDANVSLTAKNFEKTVTLSFDEIIKITDRAQMQWEQYRETNDIAILKKIIEYDVNYPVIAIGETLKFFHISPKQGFQLHIDSQIPIGSGHGSSAAVAASVAGAVSSFLQKQESKDDGSSEAASGMTDLETLSKIAIRAEQKKHGNPSYGDVGAVINGGLIWFQKKSSDEIIIEPLDLTVPDLFSKNLLVIQSGIPEESTGEMVHNVAEYKKHNSRAFERVMDEQTQLTLELLEVMKRADEERFMRIIRAGETNLETIGVVSESAKQLIREIEKSGGAAKICGAGGKKNGSGIILAYHHEKDRVSSIAKARKLSYYAVQLGEAGFEIS